MNEEPTIYQRMKAMQDKLAEFHVQWSEWFERQPAKMCQAHPEIKRSINVEKSVAESWQSGSMTASYRMCWKCVRAVIDKRNRS